MPEVSMALPILLFILHSCSLGGAAIPCRLLCFLHNINHMLLIYILMIHDTICFCLLYISLHCTLHWFMLLIHGCNQQSTFFSHRRWVPRHLRLLRLRAAAQGPAAAGRFDGVGDEAAGAVAFHDVHVQGHDATLAAGLVVETNKLKVTEGDVCSKIFFKKSWKSNFRTRLVSFKKNKLKCPLLHVAIPNVLPQWKQIIIKSTIFKSPCFSLLIVTCWII